jgi:hypothetical protein
MIEMTLQLPNSLAARIQSFGVWTSVVIELSLLNCTTNASLTAQEIIKFLENNPSPKEVLNFKVSDKAQNRLRKLLSANNERTLTEKEELEMEELGKLENIFTTLKLRAAKDLKKEIQSVN